jgi:hypothetical protein
MIRGILCAPTVNVQISGQDPNHGLPALGIAVTIGQFIRGHSLVVSRRRTPRKWKRSKIQLEQLEGFDEIWILCYRNARPGWRLLGRFLEQDALAVFRVKDKRDIGNDYSVAVEEVLSDWNDHLGTDRPCGRADADLPTYISGVHYNVDEEV